MNISLIFSGCAITLHIIAFILYNRNIVLKNCRPAITGWLLGSFISILNAVSYLLMTGDIVKTALPIVGTLLCIFTTLAMLHKGNFVRMDIYDKITFAIGLIAVFVWWYYQSATFANMLLQLCFFISMIPMYRNVIGNSENEQPSPWFLWTLAYAFNACVVTVRWQGRWPELTNPIAAIFEHFAMGIFALRKKQNPH